MRIEEVRTNGAIVVLETTRPLFNDDTGFGHISQSDFFDDDVSRSCYHYYS